MTNHFIDESYIGPHGIPIEPSDAIKLMFADKAVGLEVVELTPEEWAAITTGRSCG